MFRTRVCLAVMLLVSGALATASAQTTSPPAPEPTPSKMKLTRELLTEMRARWSANKPKLKACRQEVKSKGLVGDDRWFFMEDCMGKT
jgi:hypothetical protein